MKQLRTAALLAATLACFATIAAAQSTQKKPAGKPGATGATQKKPDEKAGASNATAKSDAAPTAPKTEKAVFGGGCFWCLEAVYERVTGVKDVVSGFAGGTVKKPAYENVLTGLTGHAEVVQIEFDPEVVSYEELLNVFWHCHDPTSLNAQGPDVGTQYRSIILYADEAQRAAAEKSKNAADASGQFASPIVTEIVPLRAFYMAERYHQDYYRKHKNAPYCAANITPKLQKLKAEFGSPETESEPPADSKPAKKSSRR